MYIYDGKKSKYFSGGGQGFSEKVQKGFSGIFNSFSNILYSLIQYAKKRVHN